MLRCEENFPLFSGTVSGSLFMLVQTSGVIRQIFFQL